VNDAHHSGTFSRSAVISRPTKPIIIVTAAADSASATSAGSAAIAIVSAPAIATALNTAVGLAITYSATA
jgi:Na+(H+)/acetate symporter ActP